MAQTSVKCCCNCRQWRSWSCTLTFCPSGNPRSPVQENTRREAAQGQGTDCRGLTHLTLDNRCPVENPAVAPRLPETPLPVLVSTLVIFLPRGHLAMSGDIPGCYNWHPVGRDWGAAEHPTMHRAVPTAKSDPAQNVECQV